MKKLLLFLTLFIGVISFAQTETDTVLKLSDIVLKSDNPQKIDSAMVELKKIISTTKDPVTKAIAPELYKVAKQLSEAKKNVVPAKSLDELSKDDLKGFRVEKDDFKKSVFISKKGWGFNDAFSPYIAIKNGNMNLRWELKYSGSDWLFIDKILFIIDGEDFSLDVDPDRKVNYGSGITENSDIFADANALNILRKISEAKEPVKVRYQGKSYSDRILDLNTCKKIGEVLALYDKLKK